MGIYKDVELDDGLLKVIRHMSRVEEYRETLQDLQGVWENLTLLGQLSGTGTDMSETRQAFNRLTAGLLHNLGNETLKKTVLEMKSKAQVAVDIMIRNLFERTADIGFLATDDDIRDYAARAPEYIRKLRQGYGSEKERLGEEFDSLTARLTERFREYVRKYSVYNNIILLDCEGNVLIQLDAGNEVAFSRDPLIRESLHTGREYVETFRHTDLVPGEDQSLIYSYRVTAAEGDEALGVLCLCFRFGNETAGIFDDLKEREDWSVITLLDSAGQVIASSDAWQIPIGAPMELVLGEDFRIVRFAGRECLAVTRSTKGYQGYTGLGWHGHVMVPLEHAFGKDASAMLELVPPTVLEDVMSNPSLFAEDLRNIPLQADRIQSELNRSVWNGNVRQSSDTKALNPAFSKILLWEISNTGLKTKDVFERSIANLHQTVVSAILQDCQFLASLAIDIMDRNLYERANDCRWWALRAYFGELLGKEAISGEELQHAQGILAHINSLYTVYDNLVLFDRHGKILAVSNPDYQSFTGRVLSESWVKETLNLRDSQSYAVSDFETTHLYLNRHTYIYGAAIRHAADPASLGGELSPGGVSGGIGIVFDSAPQFEAMLKDALPRNGQGEIVAGSFGVFADRQRRVIASTSEDIRPGAVLPLDEKFFALGNGQGVSNIIVHNGRYYAVGSRMSKGYREYKGESDAYANDVAALIFVPLCSVGESGAKPQGEARKKLQLQSSRKAGGGEAVEVATFHVGINWFGLPCTKVVEAVESKGLTPVPGASRYLRGYLLYRDMTIPVVDIHQLLPDNPAQDYVPGKQVVICRIKEEGLLGILVNSLGEIPEVSMDRLQPISTMFSGESALADSLVKPENTKESGELLLVLNPDKICQRITSLRKQGKDGAPKGADVPVTCFPPVPAKN